MILAITSLVLAFIIAFGRQIAVFGKIKAALWFFSRFEIKRLIFALTSITIGVISIIQFRDVSGVTGMFITSVCFVLFAYFFDMKYFFPEIKTVEKTTADGVSSELAVIGVKVGDQSIAYPLNEVVIPRHIINDKLNGTSILISYCALCRSALAFKAEIDSKKLYFKVAGVWRRNMIIYDTLTHSLWQQATGECIYGKQKGKQLELLSGENTNLGAWKNKHAETQFASKCIEARKGLMSRKTMLKGLNFITPKATLPGYTDLSDLPVRETVFGISYNGVSRAYPQNELSNLNSFKDEFNEKELELKYDLSSEFLSAYEVDSGKEIVVEKHWWIGWKEFHPETEIWTQKSN